jgi:hypothetical protein
MLHLEQLEPRLPTYALAPFGGFDDPHVTVSFAPAGTLWGKSGLTAEVSAMWRACVIEALEKWDAASEALEIEVVEDDGSPRGVVRNPDGTINPAQSDSRYGDIRIAEAGSTWDDGSTLDLAWYSWMPSDGWNGGGDSWVDLDHPKLAPAMADHHAMDHFSLFITGRMLGLKLSPNRDAVMNTIFGTNSSPHELTADDIAGIQALYGPPVEEEVVEETQDQPPLQPRVYPSWPRTIAERLSAEKA